MIIDKFISEVTKYIWANESGLYIGSAYENLSRRRFDLSKRDILITVYEAYKKNINYRGKHTEKEKLALGVLLVGFQQTGILNGEHRRDIVTSMFNNIKIFDKEYFNKIKYFNTVKVGQRYDGSIYHLNNTEYLPGDCIAYGIGEYSNVGINDAVMCGVFFDSFKLPVVARADNQVYMSITPNEIETMRDSIAAAHGKVLNYGLGLGYWAYEVASKHNVESVTIVELNQDIINLFNTYIAPQFEPEVLSKISIIQGDAIEYHRNLADGVYDYCFIDTWFDAYEGMDMYLNFKEQEHKFKNMRVSYWIEEDFLSMLNYLILLAFIDASINNVELSDVAKNKLLLLNSKLFDGSYFSMLFLRSKLFEMINKYMHKSVNNSTFNKISKQLFNLRNTNKILLEILK